MPQHADVTFVAVDWSGAKSASAQRKHIWYARLCGGDLSLEAGCTRERIVEKLIAEKQHGGTVIAGLDFAFSYPEWFVREQAGDIAGFWRYLEHHCERFLRCEEEPFWGRGERRHPPPAAWIKAEGLRETDRAVTMRGQHPKSAFQVNYPGAVGTGSLRGAAWLLRLREAAFAIWPFDPAGAATVVEIYPRIFTRETNVSDPDARAELLRQARYAEVPGEIYDKAVASADAFDALVSVFGMREGYTAFLHACGDRRDIHRLEGKIFSQPEAGESS